MLTTSAFRDRRSLSTRLVALRIGTILVFIGLAVSFWVLQVVRFQQYRDMAENNRLRTIPLPAPRGVVFDRNMRVLVQNRSSFTIALLREESTDTDATLALLARIAGVDEAGLRETLARFRSEPVFRPVPLIEHATEAQVYAVLLHHQELPDLDVLEVPMRTYPDGGLAAHLFGYVSEIRQSQLNRPEFQGLGPGAIVGQTGLELAYNSLLMGRDGTRMVVVNSVGREVEPLGTEPPVDGDLMQLTIDYDMQRALEDAFRFYEFNGAAAFLNPRTGEIYAMTSLPAYDPNDFAGGIDSATFGALSEDPLTPFTNRLIQGRYSPGSTFKIAMAVAALAEGIIDLDDRQYCVGSVTIYGRSWKCNGQHGWMDIRHAIQRSCNVFFYKIGEKISIDTVHAYAQKLGLVGRTGIDLPGEAASNVPSTAERAARGERWYPGETVSVAIGQGALEVTPLALATMIATVANGGTLVTPHVVRATDPTGTGRGWQPVPVTPPRSTLAIRPEHLQAVRDGLWMAVNEPGGTAVRGRIAGRDVAGKTGTAQVISLTGAAAARSRGTERDLRDHGWFVFYASRDNPQIAGVVFGEHAVHGSWVAPIARHVIETYFAKQEDRPLPTLNAVANAAAPAPAPRGGPGTR
jgi:penicillin-binding protein 2